MTTERVYLFKRFERFWHWSQAALVIALLITGFRIHGVISGFDVETGIRVHMYAAWALMVLWAFAIFWHFTTGEWRQYIPTLDRAVAVTRFYAWGIFLGESHPYHPTPEHKQNALQRLAYLWVKILINPMIWISGLALLFMALDWTTLESLRPFGVSLQTLAWAHTIAAYMMATFFVLHIYLATTGATPLAHIKAMITGWELNEQ